MTHTYTHNHTHTHTHTYTHDSFLIQGLQTRTFFFSDETLAQLKGEVMARIHHQQQQQQSSTSSSNGTAPAAHAHAHAAPSSNGTAFPPPTAPIAATAPAFVSTNDVLCAAVWKAIQGLKSRRSGPSVVHVNVDVRHNLFTTPVSENACFYWGNGVLQCAATDSDPAASPLSTLSKAIRGAIAGFDGAAVAAHIGRLKKKVGGGLGWGGEAIALGVLPALFCVFPSSHHLQQQTTKTKQTKKRTNVTHNKNYMMITIVIITPTK